MPKIRADCIRRPANPTARTYVPPSSNPRKVSDTDNWWSLARDFNMGDDPWKLIRLNFPNLPADIRSAALEVNWYLQEYVGCKTVTADGRNYKFSAQDNPGIIHVPSLLPDEIPRILPPAPKRPISQWTTEEKVKEALRRTLPLLPAEAQEAFMALLSPEALAITLTVLTVWAVSHFFGVGEVADVILLVAGGAFLGVAAIDIGEHLVSFADKSMNAKSSEDLDAAAHHLSEAIAKGGVQLVMFLLVKGSPKVFKQKPNIHYGQRPAPPIAPGKLLYKPKVTYGTLKPGVLGTTSRYGEITLRTSLKGTAREQATLLHEKVHAFLSPKFRYLIQVRAQLKHNSYSQSFFMKYLEEMLAETIALVRTAGPGHILEGLAFPVKNGYVTIAQLGMEAAGIFMGPVTVSGMAYSVSFSETKAEE
jgi:hypothetical protein